VIEGAYQRNSPHIEILVNGQPYIVKYSFAFSQIYKGGRGGKRS
jgi:hypothetical protein